MKCISISCTNDAVEGAVFCYFCGTMNNSYKVNAEKDPLGKSPHSPGAKLDSGKVQPALIIEGMARALWAVSEIATFGATKYTEGGWVEVPEGEKRYANAQYRHILKKAMGETIDPDSEKLHLAHEAWNALAKLDLYLRNQEASQ